MLWLDHSFETSAENIAFDEVILDHLETHGGEEMLWFWKPSQVFVAIGYGNDASTEANLSACRERGVPVIRRLSGGGTVVQMPGCWNYSVFLKIDQRAEIATVPGTNQFVMNRQRDAVASLTGQEIRICGDTDLAIGGRKFSGNAQRRKREWLLFHGTFLLNADLSIMESLLHQPSREPEYRAQRKHQDFVTNLGIGPVELKEALKSQWQAVGSATRPQIPEAIITKYSSQEWNLRSGRH